MKTEFKAFEGTLKAWDDTELIVEHFISTEDQDSSGDIMLADGMKIRGKPVVLFQHGLDIKFGNEPIAKVIDIRVGEHNGKKGLIAKTKYFDGTKLTPPDNTGHRLYAKAKDGTMPNWSIGFNSIKEHPVQGGRVVDEWELHEYSQVAVGMNSEATTLATNAPELKFLIQGDGSPDGFADMKAFEAATVEIVDLGDVDEMVCVDGACSLVKADGMKPYANEHACRIREPGDFSKFRRQNGAREHEGKKYDVIYGQLKGSDKWTEQAYRYPKDTWSAEQASTHCKSHDGRFEAAKAVADGETKSSPAPVAYKRARKAIKALHKELLSDLKTHGAREDLIDAGAEKCAKEAIDEFSDGAAPHVERYIKIVRDMATDDDLEGEDDDTAEPEEKGFRAAMNNLNKALRGMIKSIHGYKCNKAVVPSAETEKCLTEHATTATPHAIDFIKAWHDKCRADAEIEREMKPTLEKLTLSVPADDDEDSPKFFVRKLPEQTTVLRVKPPTPPSTLTVKTGAPAKSKITRKQFDELLNSIESSMTEIIRAELRKAAGKVT